MVALAAIRPPFVEFKTIAKDDRIASEEKGFRVTRDVDFAFIMQAGSKDCVEKEAAAWLASIKQKLVSGSPDAYPQEWVDSFHKKYAAWKEGQDAPVNGTSVREWPLLSPAQAQNFIALGMPAIEDVAAMTEEAMQRFGMGARVLRDKAREWLQGKDVAAAVMEENNALKIQLAELADRLAKLEAAPVASGADEDKPRRGRPPRVDVVTQ